MNPWNVWIALVVVVFVVMLAAAVRMARWRHPWRLTCPLAGTEAQIKFTAPRALLAAMLGRSTLAVGHCSRWPTVRSCRDDCLTLPISAWHPVRRGEPPPRDQTREQHTILVPLDGSSASEAVLGIIGGVARAYDATVRLVRVLTPPEAVEAADGSRIVAFTDQEGDRLTRETQAYFRRLEARLPGIVVEGAVRFGDPVARIIEEAESVGAELIAMASRRGRGLGAQLSRRSVAKRLRRETTIPLLLLPYEERPAA